MIEITGNSKKSDAVKVMAGHILKRGQITVWYKPERYSPVYHDVGYFYYVKKTEGLEFERARAFKLQV